MPKIPNCQTKSPNGLLCTVCQNNYFLSDDRKNCITSEQLRISLGLANLLDISSNSKINKLTMDRGASDSSVDSYFLFYPSINMFNLINF